MDLLGLLLNAGAVALVCLTIYVANRASALGAREDPLLRTFLTGLIAFNALFGIMTSTSLVEPSAGSPNPDYAGVLGYLGTSLAVSFASFIFVRSMGVRQRFCAILPANTRFDATSPVHTAAGVLCLLMVSITLGQFVAIGGLSGLAEDIQVAGVSFTEVIFNQAMWLLAAFLGIGLWLRRTPRAAALRLGLRVPTSQDVLSGIGVGVGMVVLLLGFTIVWISLASPDQFAAQNAASSLLAESFNTLPTALLLSILVSVGEEIFFRGALRPVFGNVLTSIFFLMLHTQYTFSPATLPLFFTSLALGWLRERYSTSASIIGHFVFNFTQLFLSIAAGG